MSGPAAGKSGYVKTTLIFTTYDEENAKEIIEYLKTNHKVLEWRRSDVIRELYYVSIEGNVPSVADEIKDRVIWVKTDVLEFK